MNSLRTARVLIVDDVAEQAMPIIKVLGSFGIGCVYVSGDKLEDLEKMTPLSGIRLAFVDMELQTAGTMREILGKTVNVLRTIIAHDTAPIMFVAWTQNDNYVDDFRIMLGNAMPNLQPLVVLPMPKPFTKTGRIKARQVVADVKRLLKDRRPLGVLWLWEQMSHDAATITTQAIAELVTARNNTQPGVEWKTSLGEILRLLLDTGAGQNQDVPTVSQGLLDVLNSLHLDGLEHQSSTAYRKEIRPISKLTKPKLTPKELVTINSMLLLSPANPVDLAVRPGNVYVQTKTAGLGCPHAICTPDAQGLISDLFDLKGRDAEYKKLSDQLNSQTSAAGKSEIKRKLRTRLTAIQRQVKIVLVEVTAPCDYSQRRTRFVSRFVAGLLVPELLGKLIKTKPSSKGLELAKIQGMEGTWSLVLSARFPYAIGKPDESIKATPVFRLRNTIVIDIQAWLAAQSSRPGYLALH